jgi:hypothetical protein
MALDRDNTPSLRLGYPQLMAPQKVDPSSGGLQWKVVVYLEVDRSSGSSSFSLLEEMS